LWIKYGVSVDTDILYPILAEARVFKSDGEIEVMRKCTEAASEGHVLMMKHCKPGILESALSAKFRCHAYENYNMRHLPYGNIVGSGSNAATLHYHELDKVIEPNELVLLDLGTQVQNTKISKNINKI
jgi:Xaa-Pro aminopeptidase